VILALVVGWMIVRSPDKTPPAAPRLIEEVRKSKPTLTRVLRPKDLKIVNATMEVSQSSSNETVDARHFVVVGNDGELAYRNITLAFAYFTKEGKALETRTHLISDPLSPGKTVSAQELVMKALPRATSTCTPTVLYADIEPGGAQPAPPTK
jgi:hypothetical protein